MNDINDSSSTTAEPLVMLLQQQPQQMQQFSTVLTLLQQQMADHRTNTPRQPSTVIASSAMDSVLKNTITTFSYAPDEDITFAAWYKRYEDIFKLLNKIDSDNQVTLNSLIAHYRHLVTLKRDTKTVEHSSGLHATVNKTKLRHKPRSAQINHPSKPTRPKDCSTKNIPESPCWQCGGVHYVKDCSYNQHKCTTCGIVGHKEGYCNFNRKHNQRSRHIARPAFTASSHHKTLINDADIPLFN
ncbi:unnamed protein product [Anisakis simplex]|uniref:CCHC-type domain-containing protein n=1 Tax=Anisakis simplex TaxID=6269 RepID=A0A0M3JRH2_ANISI|nr:unnamed protein product [Anisakis simplex]